MLATAATLTASARLLAPIISDIYNGAKKFGANGFKAWEAKSFPKKLAGRLRYIDEVKTIWSPDKELPLANFYYPSKLVIDNKPSFISRLSEIGDGNFIIEGTVGQGKSMFLRHIATGEILSNDAQRLPLFIELRTLGPRLSLSQAILKQLSVYDIEFDEQSISYLYNSGRLSLLLDGFDELEQSLEKETLIELEFLSQKYPKIQIIATSRPKNAIQKSAIFRILPIAPLSSADYAPFLAKLNVPAVQSILIRDAIKKSPNKLTSLITTPLMLTMVVIVYQSENEIPETLPDFFEKLFHVVFTRHDKLKAAYERKHHSGLSERRLQELFEAFCFMTMQLDFTRSLSSQQFIEAFDDALSYCENCGCEVEHFKLDITKVACLMLDEGFDTTTFLHKSIQEYYAAAFIKHSPDGVATMFYAQVIDNSKNWREVLSFLKNIDPYRFSTYFAIPESKLIQEKVLCDLEHGNDSSLIALLDKLYPALSVGFGAKSGDADMRPMRYGPFKAEDQIGLHDFTSLLLAAMDETIPSTMTRSAIIELFNGLMLKNEKDIDMYEVPIGLLIKKLGKVCKTPGHSDWCAT